MTVEIADIRAKTFDISVRGHSIQHRALFLSKPPIAVDPTQRTAASLPRAISQALDAIADLRVE